MTIRVSKDEGKTWPVEKLIYPRSSAYSSLVGTDDEHLVCLFEGGPEQYQASGIAAVRVPLQDLSIRAKQK